MSKIFVSAMAYDSGKSGISVCIDQLLEELAKTHQLEVLALRDDLSRLPAAQNIKYLETASFLRRPLVNMFWHLFILPYALKWKNYDFILLPAGNRRLLAFCRKFTIAVVHDLSQYHVERKYDCFRMLYCKRILPFYLRRVDRVVAVSGSTAADLERFWRIPASRITVSYNGFDRNKFNPEAVDGRAVRAKYGLEKNYILYVSRIEHPGKNHLNLIRAYERLPEPLRDAYDLVLAGSFWPGAEAVRDYAARSGSAANIRFIGFVVQDELPALYHGAAMYIFPSLFEGFGLPLVEALACGIPAACSATSSLGEIGGDAVLRFNPENPDEIRSAMQDILEKPALRDELVRRGFARLSSFDWARQAADLIRLYENRNESAYRGFWADSGIRMLDFLFALAVSVGVALPVFGSAAGRRLFTGKSIFRREKIYGRDERILTVRYFNFDNIVCRCASLFFHVLTFKLRLVGVSVHAYPEPERRPGDADLFRDRPGIFSLWFLRRSRGIAYGGRLETELEYLRRRSFHGDVMIILRSVPALLLYNKQLPFPPQINLLDVRFDNLNMKQVIDAFAADIAAGRRKKVYFVNSDCFNKTFHDRNYLEILRQGDYILPDGVGILIACKMLKTGLKENVNGTDMLPFLCELAVRRNYSLFLFGARPGVAALMQRKLQEAYPGLRILGARDGYFSGPAEEAALLAELKALEPDILLTALGVPLQEKWIAAHAGELPCRLMLGVGGLFDFYSGRIKRAPRWLREIGLEWVFRLAMEPVRMFRRYIIGNPLFLWRVFRWEQNTRK
ncbi:MAG: WecB/TagA/CpsF family glycosyltransferase [Victivallaceae bacterium]|nr:WecB/TagA/CpsF family glycosyltransferase [Victivallaceae bacterium]